MRSWLVGLIALCALADAGNGRLVVGRVVEEGSRVPVPGAAIRLLTIGGAERATVVADREGTFQLAAPAPGGTCWR